MIMIFTVQQSWKMSEAEKVLAIIIELGCWRLGNWDGCACSRFSLRDVDIEIACGKGGEQGVWVRSASCEYDDVELLRPIMEEVVRQCDEGAGRATPFIGHIANDRPASAR